MTCKYRNNAFLEETVSCIVSGGVGCKTEDEEEQCKVGRNEYPNQRFFSVPNQLAAPPICADQRVGGASG